MMKLVFAAAAIALSGHAFAQDTYSKIVEKQRFCEMTGEVWREVFEKGTALGKTLKQLSKEREEGKLTKDQHMHFVMIFIAAEGNKEFRDGQDAYMAGWAKCMDGKQF